LLLYIGLLDSADIESDAEQLRDHGSKTYLFEVGAQKEIIGDAHT